jgi:hypothetical protein
MKYDGDRPMSRGQVYQSIRCIKIGRTDPETLSRPGRTAVEGFPDTIRPRRKGDPIDRRAELGTPWAWQLQMSPIITDMAS